MNLLKKENWVICCILNFLTEGIFTLILAHFMKLYDKDAWYCKWQYWVIGLLCLIFPIVIMYSVFTAQMLCKVAANLNVPGKEIYNSPYSWILCLIVPIIGWILLIVMIIYIQVFTIVALYKGEGEKFIN